MTENSVALDNPGTKNPDGSPSGPAPRTGLALAVILTCQLMVVLDSAVVTIALPDIQRTLHFSTVGLSWVQNAYMLAFGGLLLLGGRTGDIFGRRKTFIYGVGLFTIASLVGGLANSSGLLLVARAAQGLGAAVAAPSTLALIITTYQDATKRARAIALYSTVTGAGAAIGLILGGVLTTEASWRWVFFINVPFGVAVVLLTPLVIREPERIRGRLDIPGALTATAGTVALVYGFIRAASNGWGDGAAIGSLVAAVVLLVGFVLIEARTQQPLVPLGLLAQRTRGGSYLALLLVAASMFGMFFFLTQYLQNVLGYSPLRAGFAFLPFAVFMFVGAAVVQPLVAKLGGVAVLIAGTVLVGVGLLWLTQVGAGTSYAGGVLGPVVLFGLGGGFAFVPLSLAILGGVPPEDSGTASGILQATQQVGGSLGTAVLVTFFNTAVRHPGGQISLNPLLEARRALSHGVDVTMGVSAAFAAGALLLILALIRLPRPDAAAPSAVEEVDQTAAVG
ncbi:MFS transporter [Streptacidiphilus sp. P02-A3a]|uniref:MFS transporter n=1 Tax=Streptacidiphilus sp. P02-A3a TaxID=2704468 RepID=UPI0015F9CA8C|nr:MFS transporter [Streptacidiphilus sp. P02-A3a]QMU71140.1 MFS transporter [Streptacidiphilus sp. P02-A3a]